jgi:hypothetical protein
MQTLEYTYVDRSKWHPAAQELCAGEPDKIQFLDEATGMPCLIVRGGSGAWCGYVGVSPGHPLYEKEYHEANNIDCHGGLTFDGFCHENPENHGICHLVETGEEAKVWWLGFDCAHSCDLTPKYDFDENGQSRYGDGYSSYRDVRYVKHEVTKLAAQLKHYDPLAISE